MVALTKDQIFEKLNKHGAIISNSHVVLTPKPDGFYHSAGYFTKDEVFCRPQILLSIANLIALEFNNDKVDMVVGPTAGAVGPAAVVALRLHEMRGREIFWGYAEEKTKSITVCPVVEGLPMPQEQITVVEKGVRVVKRVFPKYIEGGKNVLIIEDVASSGGSVLATIKAVREAGGEVIGVAVVCNRAGITAKDLGVPKLFTLFDIPIQMFKEEECPLCAQNIPIEMGVGHGEDFYSRHPGSQVPRKV